MKTDYQRDDELKVYYQGRDLNVWVGYNFGYESPEPEVGFHGGYYVEVIDFEAFDNEGDKIVVTNEADLVDILEKTLTQNLWDERTI